MSIVALEVVKDLRRAFAGRGLTRHASNGDVRLHADAQQRVFVVLDPKRSRTILASRCVENENYFAEPLAQLAQRGNALPHVTPYFAHSVLFKEGADHRALRARQQPIIEDACAVLASHEALLARSVTRGHGATISPLQFAQRLVEVGFAVVIRHLTGVPLKRALRAMRLRQNAFFYHFHPARHQGIDRALAQLEQGRAGPDTSDAWEVARSLIVMGVDPCVSAVCAAVMEKLPGDFAAAINRYAPTSFISRRCVATFRLDEHAVQPGDLLYLSLVRPGDAKSEQGPAVAFGAGPHMCAGRPFALLVSKIAERIYRDLEPGRISDPGLVVRGDGSFLSITEPAAAASGR